MKKRVYLDMDGTIANLYKINNWLERLQREDKTIFLECEKMVSQEKLFEIFPKKSYEIIILSMTPKNCSEDYHKQVASQKNKWLDKNFPLLNKRIYLKYGYNKNLKNSKNAILIDDSKAIRDTYKGITIDPMELWG